MISMETIKIPGVPVKASRIGPGTWAIGGWMWSGTEEDEAISTIQAALDKGINLIDTAPVYGFGALRRIGWPGTCGRQERRRDHRHQGRP